MKASGFFIILGIVTLLAAAADIFFGAVALPANDVWAALAGNSGDDIVEFIVNEHRIPMTVCALLSGASLAVCGLMLQTAFRNPLAGPSILGISSGASLGVAIILLAFGGSVSLGSASFGGQSAIIIAALLGSLLITAILSTISITVKNGLMLLIVGILVGYLTSSVTTLLSSLSSAEGVHGFVMWGMGSFSVLSLGQMPFYSILIALGLLYALSMAKPLNILLLGDNYARSLGIKTNSLKTQLLICTGFLTAIVTAYCGPIAFIGLASPHIVRLMAHTDNHWILMPGCMLVGAAIAAICCVASVAFTANVIPINALTPIVGVPVILYVLLRKK